MILDRPTLLFATHEDGSWERLSPWFPLLLIPASLLEAADQRRFILRDEFLTIRCTNGWACYRLSEPDAEGNRSARLLEAR